MKRAAGLSVDGKYRWWLYRSWEPDPNREDVPLLWVMLNPSTADAEVDDPTITRCIRFSTDWGYNAMYVVNKFSYRSTDPGVLGTISAEEARGPKWEYHMRATYARCITVVAAWGNPGGRMVPEMFQGQRVWCLGKTKTGAPRHPLYLPAITSLDIYQ